MKKSKSPHLPRTVQRPPRMKNSKSPSLPRTRPPLLKKSKSWSLPKTRPPLLRKSKSGSLPRRRKSDSNYDQLREPWARLNEQDQKWALKAGVRPKCHAQWRTWRSAQRKKRKRSSKRLARLWRRPLTSSRSWSPPKVTPRRGEQRGQAREWGSQEAREGGSSGWAPQGCGNHPDSLREHQIPLYRWHHCMPLPKKPYYKILKYLNNY